MARLRHHTFFNLSEANTQIRILLEDLNNRPFKQLEGCRRSLYEQMERSALKALPKAAYTYIEFKKARVNIDYHIVFDKHYYSVPHHLCRRDVDVRASQEGVAIFYQGNQVARHPRAFVQGGHTTTDAHMPTAHRKHKEWTPERLLEWANALGPSVQAVTALLLERKKHPEQAYRSCLGLLSLSRQYDPGRLERACARALKINSANYSSVKSILTSGLDKLDIHTHQSQEASETLLNEHDNIRGSTYYH